MAKAIKKVFVLTSLAGAFNLAHRKNEVHEFDANQADEIVEKGYGRWLSEEELQGKSKKKKTNSGGGNIPSTVEMVALTARAKELNIEVPEGTDVEGLKALIAEAEKQQ